MEIGQGRSWKTAILATAFALAASLTSCGPGKGAGFQIGAILPLTGPSARYGTWIQEGLDLGTQEINGSGGIQGRRLQIIYEDDQANPTLAANAMRKLADSDKVPVVFGSWASSSVLAEAPIAEATKTVVLAEAISPKIRDAGDYIFRIQPDAHYYIREFVPVVIDKLGVHSVSILYVNNDFGLDQADVFQTEFERLGGRVLSRDGFEQSASDFKTELIKIKAQKPQAIFCPAYTEIAIILRQARELGMSQTFLASVPFENPDILQAAGRAAEGVLYPHHFDSDSPDAEVRRFQAKYKAKYGRPAEGFAALAYDGIKILGTALTRCGADTGCIKTTLYMVRDFPGVTGPTSFDDHGDVSKRIIIKTVRNGTFVRLE